MTSVAMETSSQSTTRQFRCQNCSARLSLDRSLRDLDKETVQSTIDSFRMRDSQLRPDELLEQVDEQEEFMNSVISDDSQHSDANEFLLLDGMPSISQNLSCRLAVYESLFKFLNTNCTFDHPLCSECAEKLQQLQADRVAELEDEVACLQRYAERLEGEEASGSSAEEAAAEQLRNMEAEEVELRQQLADAGEQLEQVGADAKAEEARSVQLRAEYQQLQHEYSELKRQLLLLEDELTASKSQQGYAEYDLNRLQNTSVLSAAFHIWYDSQMASINGFKMGKPHGSGSIDWPELNAGWGQCALLLQAIGQRLGFESQNFKLLPCCSQSEIQTRRDSKRLPLYSSAGRIFSDSAFDAGMAAYLANMAELQAFVKERWAKVKVMPYPIHQREIEDNGVLYSIQRAGNRDDKWTMALRLMLLDLKMVLTWMSTESTLQNV